MRMPNHVKVFSFSYDSSGKMSAAAIMPKFIVSFLTSMTLVMSNFPNPSDVAGSSASQSQNHHFIPPVDSQVSHSQSGFLSEIPLSTTKSSYTNSCCGGAGQVPYQDDKKMRRISDSDSKRRSVWPLNSLARISGSISSLFRRQSQTKPESKHIVDRLPNVQSPLLSSSPRTLISQNCSPVTSDYCCMLKYNSYIDSQNFKNSGPQKGQAQVGDIYHGHGTVTDHDQRINYQQTKQDLLNRLTLSPRNSLSQSQTQSYHTTSNIDSDLYNGIDELRATSRMNPSRLYLEPEIAERSCSSCTFSWFKKSKNIGNRPIFMVNNKEDHESDSEFKWHASGGANNANNDNPGPRMSKRCCEYLNCQWFKGNNNLHAEIRNLKQQNTVRL